MTKSKKSTKWIIETAGEIRPEGGSTDRNAYQATRRRAERAAASEIGEIPAVVAPDRREACRLDLLRFLTTYFPESTGLCPFCSEQINAIKRIELCVLKGGYLANVFPRGFAKTTISENACLWMVLYGHRRFPVLIGADEPAAKINIESILGELESNDLLLDDFPEVCFPFRALEGKYQRCKSQLCGGRRTHIHMRDDRLVMPTLPGSSCSGSIIVAKGLMCGVRGIKYKRPGTGENLRPDFFVADDPQTTQSARSPLECGKRIDTINGTVLYLAGRRRKMSGVINGTVIQPGDVVAHFLDRKKSPSWQGSAFKMVQAFADAHETLWLEQYAAIRNDCDPSDPEDYHAARTRATDFYLAHREAMDAGCVVTWEHCYDPETEISAIQSAYNSLIDSGHDAFMTECQNEPPGDAAAADNLTREQLESAVRNIPRGVVPSWCDTLTAAVDVHDDMLFWVLTAWDRNTFAGHVVDYGVWPEQGTRLFRQGAAKKHLCQQYPGRGKEAALRAGIDHVVGQLMGRTYRGQDGSQLQVARIFVDCGYQQELVYQAVSESNTRVVHPSKGVGVRAAQRPFGEHKRNKSRREVIGDNWRELNLEKYRSVRRVLYEANHWKTFIRERLQTPTGDAGALSIFQEKPSTHQLFFEHLLVEKGVLVEADGRKVTEWPTLPGRDNHWWDDLVYTAVAASVEGVQMRGVTGEVAGRRGKRRPKLKLSELQNRRGR